MKIEYRKIDTFVITNDSGQKFIRISKNIWTDGKKILDEKERGGLEAEFRKNIRGDFKTAVMSATEVEEFEE